MTMFRQVRTLLVSIFVLMLSSVALAQNAQIQGQVTDASGAVIPNATLRIVDQRTNTERRTQTNGSGEYVVPGLLPSVYKILVLAPGFSSATSGLVTLNVGENGVLDFKLQVGSEASEIMVNADNASVNTTDATVSTVVDRQFVENIPLNGRTFQSLIGSTPGVVTTPTPVAGEQGQFSVVGQRAGSNYFTVDGVSANFASAVAQYEAQTGNGGLPAFSALGTTGSLASVDALQEFRIENSTYTAEYGRQSGAQIALVTRSGTNEFHGAAFDYLRNDALDATDWFADNTGQPKPREHQNDFGGVLGGPLWRDKAFFFFSYEGLRVTQPLFQLSDVPTVLSRASAASNVQAIVNAFPLPNGPDTDPGLAQLATSSPNHSTFDATSLRVDYAINQKLNVFGRFVHSPSSSIEVFASYPGNNPFTTAENIDTGTLGVTSVITPTITNDFRFNISHAQGSQISALSSFGGAVVPAPDAIWSSIQNTQSGNAYYFVENARNVQFNVGKFGDNLNRQTNITDGLSIVRGAHLLKVGVDYRRMTPIYGPPSSFLSYGWIEASNWIGGAPSDLLSFTEDRSDVRQMYHNVSVYAQDTWKVSPRLNVSYGIRWDYNPPPSETNGAANAPYTLSEVTDLSTATLLPQGSPLWHADWKNFAPRLGLAYRLGGNEKPLVLRAGFGQFYDLGTDTAPFVNNAEGWFPYSLTTTLCQFGEGPGCGNAVPYSGPKPPFDLTQGGAGGETMRAFDPHLKLPYFLEWSFALEKTLSPNQTIKATYLGSAGRRLLRDDITTNTNPATQDLFVYMYVTKNIAYSNYNAFQVQFQRRLSHGLQALVSYAWSHALDTNSSDVAYLSPYPSSTVYNVSRDYGNADVDFRHSIAAVLTYNVPTVKTGNRVARTILSNWSLSSNNTARTGIPFNVFYTPTTAGSIAVDGSPFQLRPNTVAGQPIWIHTAGAPGGRELNPAAFAIPSVSTQGTEGRNDIYGFPLLEMDFGLRRQFNITEGINLQFRSDLFNIINHPNFSNPLNTIGTCSLGVPCPPVFGWGESQSMLNQGIGAGNYHGTALNALYQVGGPRSLQVSMKLQF